VDVLVCILRDGGHRHGLAGLSERFVGSIAENLTKMSDGGGELGHCRVCEWISGKTRDDGGRFGSSESVQKYADDSEWAAHARDVARVVVVAHRKHHMIQRLHGDCAVRFEARQEQREKRLVEAVTAVLSDRQAAAACVQPTNWICGS